MNANSPRPWFSPYGYLSQAYKREREETAPAKWVPPAGTAGTTPLEQWKTWRDGIVHDISNVLWPRWDHSTHTWQGEATAFMEELTRNDLDLMATIPPSSEHGLDSLIKSPLAAGNARTHRPYFEMEDYKWAGDLTRTERWEYPPYEEYDCSLRLGRARFVTTNLKAEREPFLPAAVVMQFKWALQRPRPYQCAMLLGYGQHYNEEAGTAATPSMCSGHALQGVMGYARMYQIFQEKGWFESEESRDSMMQAAVDIGDRRVMAGVHFPSDNLCSWIIALKIVETAFPDGKQFKSVLRKGIKSRSVIYALMKNHGVYGPALGYFETI